MMKLIVFIRLPVTRAAAPAPASAPAPDRAPASNATLWPLVFQLLLLPPLLLLLRLLTHCVMCPGGASLSCCNVTQIVSRFMQIREFMSCSPLSHFKRIFWAACNTHTNIKTEMETDIDSPNNGQHRSETKSRVMCKRYF